MKISCMNQVAKYRSLFRMRSKLAVMLAAAMLLSCNYKKETPVPEPEFPFPSNEFAPAIQQRVDSLDFIWFLDSKATASAFCNEELYGEEGVSTSDIVLLGEGLFHAKVEVHLPTRILILTMERPFKEKGVNSIWQVTKMEVKDWPKSGSK